MSSESPFYQYPTHSKAFLARASESLADFDVNLDVSSFLYAALHLRFGIEARLNEYISVALNTLGRTNEPSSQYVATKLLKRLVKLNPNAHQGVSIRATSGDTGELVFEGKYVPVSKRLAEIHGQLGEFLHHKYFQNYPYWNLRTSLNNGHHKTLVDQTRIVREGIDELAHTVSGSLLGHPIFTSLVEDILDSDNTQGDEEED